MILLSVPVAWLVVAIIGSSILTVFVVTACVLAKSCDDPRLNHWNSNFNGKKKGFNEEDAYN